MTTVQSRAERWIAVRWCTVSVALVLALAACSSGSADASAAHVAAILASNVKDSYAADDWYQTLQLLDAAGKVTSDPKTGVPNIEVVATTAFVFTGIANNDLGKSNAETICHAVAAVTNDPNTAAPLGIRHVKVDGGSGNDELAACDVP